MIREQEQKQNAKTATVRSAKECTLLAVFTALVIAVQLALSALPGVELVTVLFVAFSYTFGWKRGVFAAVVFALLRQLVFGFFPTVLVLYLTYYTALTCVFGLLGKRIPITCWGIILLTATACLCTIGFTLLDDILTPFWYGYTPKAAKAYFYASLYFLIPQIVCTAVSVALLLVPLHKVFLTAKITLLHLK